MEVLKEEFLRLITEDRTFRLAVAGALGLAEVIEHLEKLDEEVAENTRAIRALQEQVAENTRAIKALQEQVAEHSKAIRALQEQVAEHTKAIRALQEQVAEHSKAIRALQEQVAENTRAIKALQEQVAEHSKAIRALQEQVAEHAKALTEHSKAIKALQEQMGELTRSVRNMSRTVTALGARWGLLAEEAFRDAMRDIVERLFGGKVERWVYFDEEGFVFGHPSIIEVDLVIRDGEHVLIEVKASASRADVRELANIGRLYEMVRGVRPKLAIVSPHVEPRALTIAEKLGVKVYMGESLEE